MINLNLSSLTHTEVGRRETIVLDAKNLVIDDLTLNNLQGELCFTRVAHGILCQGNLTVNVEVDCTRCLVPFYTPTTIELEDTISLPGAALTPEYPVRVTEDGWVDLTPLIREYVWLGIPQKPVCTPGCRGICSDCGGNINLGECSCGDKESIDPRWEALRALIDNSEEPSN